MKPKKLREAFNGFPAVLQHQILLRFGWTLGGLAAFGLFWALSGQFWFSAPFLMLSAWMGVSAIQLFRTIWLGRYVRVQATCRQIITTAILKRPKALILSTEQGDLRLRIQQRIRKPEVGEVFTLYLADDAHLYQGDEGYIVSAYLAFARESSAVSTSIHP